MGISNHDESPKCFYRVEENLLMGLSSDGRNWAGHVFEIEFIKYHNTIRVFLTKKGKD